MLPLVQLLYLVEVLALSGQILYVFEDFFLSLLEPMQMRNNLLLFLVTLIDSITQNIHQMDICRIFPFRPITNWCSYSSVILRTKYILL